MCDEKKVVKYGVVYLNKKGNMKKCLLTDFQTPAELELGCKNAVSTRLAAEEFVEKQSRHFPNISYVIVELPIHL